MFLVYITWCLVFFASIPVGLAEGGSLPRGVARAAGSVFRMVPLNANDVSTAEQRREKIAGECREPQNFIGKLRCDFMRDECPSEGLCAIPFISSGTAFVTGDGSILNTAFHVAGAAEILALTFLGTSLAESPRELVEKIFAAYSPAFLLYDADGNKIYDTREYSEAHHFESVGDPLSGFRNVRNGGLPAQLAGFATDFAQIKLRKVVAKGLQTKVPDTSDGIFWALGYPMRTQGRAINYDGFHIFANQGLRFDMKDCGRMFGFKPDDDELNYPLLFFGNDIVQGFSGGPLFNELGQVIGLVSATLSDEHSFRGAGFGVPWQDFSQFQIRR